MTRFDHLPPRQAVEAFRRFQLESLHKPNVQALLAGRARADQNVQRLYAGRFLFELLQNACDAHDRQLALSKERMRIGRVVVPDPGVARASVVIDKELLLVANTGWPFSFYPIGKKKRSGIEAICDYGASTKGEEEGLKGRFGIGFKSVDEIANEVLIHSTMDPPSWPDGGAEPFRLSFSRAKLREDIRGLGETVTPPEDLPLIYVPAWLSETVEPLEALAHDHTTVVGLRLRETARRQIHGALAQITPVVMLFLETLDHLRVQTGDEWRQYELSRAERQGQAESWTVTERRSDWGEPREHHFHLYRTPIGSHDGRVVWRRRQGELVPLNEDERQFFTFYPVSSEFSGVPFYIHAPFELDPSRTRFARGEAERNTQILDQVVDLVDRSIEDLATHPRGGAPLHALLWPESIDARVSDPVGRFREALRAALWERPVLEGWNADRRPGESWKFPVDGGFDQALEGASVEQTPFPREAWRLTLPRVGESEEESRRLEPDDLASWIRDNPPGLAAPERFGQLLSALSRVVAQRTDREAFCQAVRGAKLLPTADGEWVGISESKRVFVAGAWPISIPPQLRSIYSAWALHPAAIRDDSTLRSAASELFDVPRLQPRDLVLSLCRAVAGHDEVISEDLAMLVLELVLEVLLLGASDQDEFIERIDSTAGRPCPWFFEDSSNKHPSALWRVRQGLSSLPIPREGAPLLPARELVVERNGGDLTKLYPDHSGLLMPSNEDARVRRLIEQVGRKLGVSSVGWDFRSRVYLLLGCWGIPRLHAVAPDPEAKVDALASPHTGISDQDWERFLRHKDSQFIRYKTLIRSLAWSELPVVVQHCEREGRLKLLLQVVTRNAEWMLPPQGHEIYTAYNSRGSRRILPLMVKWQLQNERWLPVGSDPNNAIAAEPTDVWWTHHYLQNIRTDNRWRYLPFVHAGVMHRHIAQRLLLPEEDRPHSPKKHITLERTLAAISTTRDRVELELRNHTGDPLPRGLVRMYKDLTQRLSRLSPTPEDLSGITHLLVERGGGRMALAERNQALHDDLTFGLPMGRESLNLAVMGQDTEKLSDALGIRRLSSSETTIRYLAEDRDEVPLLEPRLTRWLQNLGLYAFAIRAHSQRIQENQRISFRERSTMERAKRYSRVQAEVVAGVSLEVDGEIKAVQDASFPFVIAHDVEPGGRLPVFFCRQVVETYNQAEGMLPRLAARAAARLAGDDRLASDLELLLRFLKDGPSQAADSFLADQHGIDQETLDEVRSLLGQDDQGDPDSIIEPEPLHANPCIPRFNLIADLVLGRLMFMGVQVSQATITSFFVQALQCDDPLGAVIALFAEQGVDAADPLWAVTDQAAHDALLRGDPKLAEKILQAQGEVLVAQAEKAKQEEATQEAERFCFALVCKRAPEVPLLDLTDSWAEVTTRQSQIEKIAQAFLSHWKVEQVLVDRVLAPDGCEQWSKEHATLLGLTTEDLYAIAQKLSDHDRQALHILTQAERLFRQEIRRNKFDQNNPAVELVLPEQGGKGAPPAEKASSASMGLTLKRKGSARRHAGRGKKNTLTGSYGEVFVWLQQLHLWRELGQAELERLLDRVRQEFSPTDLQAQAAMQQVKSQDSASSEWEEALGRLVLIGDYPGARCDLLGIRKEERTTRFVYIEVKSTNKAQLRRFYLTKNERSFLESNLEQSEIHLVGNACRGKRPTTRIIRKPERIVPFITVTDWQVDLPELGQE